MVQPAGLKIYISVCVGCPGLQIISVQELWPLANDTCNDIFYSVYTKIKIGGLM